MHNTFDGILEPVKRETFLSDYWTKQFLFIPGAPDKFSDLYPWSVLDRALEDHRFYEERLVLVRAGKKIDPAQYLFRNRVHSGKLLQLLAGGATLIFNQCEEFHPPLRDLCLELERLFHVNVVVNLYAGWRHDNGFDVHWDDQDVIILQVSGRKHWQIWNPTRLHPFKDDAVDTGRETRPASPAIWDNILEPGSVLSIPRGWWHIAVPIDEPCLHLTVTIRNRNGIDLLNWLANSMKKDETARMAVPVTAPSAERAGWVDKIRGALLTELTDDVIERFLAEEDSKTVPRPKLALPLEVPERDIGITEDTPLRLSAERPLHFLHSEGAVTFRANGTKWRTDRETAEKLAKFNDFKPHSLGDLTERHDFRLSVMVGALTWNGVLRRA